MTTHTFARCDTGAIVELELPTCPDCGATGKRCTRPSGHTTAFWHVARELLLAPLLGCCADWTPDAPPRPAEPDTALFELEGQLS